MLQAFRGLTSFIVKNSNYIMIEVTDEVKGFSNPQTNTCQTFSINSYFINMNLCYL